MAWIIPGGHCSKKLHLPVGFRVFYNGLRPKTRKIRWARLWQKKDPFSATVVTCLCDNKGF